VVPGAAAARQAGAEVHSRPGGLLPIYLHQQSGFGFDGALRDIARTYDVATARWVAKTLQYPNTNPQLTGSAWPWTLTLEPILIGVVAALTTVLSIELLRRRLAAHSETRS
jgi:hypothetical protein